MYVYTDVWLYIYCLYVHTDVWLSMFIRMCDYVCFLVYAYLTVFVCNCLYIYVHTIYNYLVVLYIWTYCRVWCLYQRLGCYLRCGTATAECTMLQPTHHSHTNDPSTHDQTPAGGNATGNTSGSAGGSDYPVNILTLEPSSDHSLAYLVLEEGVRTLCPYVVIVSMFNMLYFVVQMVVWCIVLLLM